MRAVPHRHLTLTRIPLTQRLRLQPRCAPADVRARPKADIRCNIALIPFPARVDACLKGALLAISVQMPSPDANVNSSAMRSIASGVYG